MPLSVDILDICRTRLSIVIRKSLLGWHLWEFVGVALIAPLSTSPQPGFSLTPTAEREGKAGENLALTTGVLTGGQNSEQPSRPRRNRSRFLLPLTIPDGWKLGFCEPTNDSGRRFWQTSQFRTGPHWPKWGCKCQPPGLPIADRQTPKPPESTVIAFVSTNDRLNRNPSMKPNPSTMVSPQPLPPFWKPLHTARSS